jgi:hypothetical protein
MAASVEVTPIPAVVAASGYVPEPQPVRSDLDIGVFYFPGWDTWTRWKPILDFPERKPVLGWYDEANPECADWQIKWAVEHGVRFFMVDWYWDRGNRHLEHWLHQAYSKARHRHHLQWAIMWANHNPPGSHSREDWRRVTQYWIDHYFGMDEYYRIDDRPAVFVWAPANIRNDLGGSQAAGELYALSQQMAQQAGYKGIYFVAMSSHESAAQCTQLLDEGYEAFTSYHGFQLAEARAAGKQFPFSHVVRRGPKSGGIGRRAGFGAGLHPDRRYRLGVPAVARSAGPGDPRPDTGIVRAALPVGSRIRPAERQTDRRPRTVERVGRRQLYRTVRRAWLSGPRTVAPRVLPAGRLAAQSGARRRGTRTLRSPAGSVADLLAVRDTEDDLQGWSPNGALRIELADEGCGAESVGSDPILPGRGFDSRRISIASWSCG